MSKVQPEQKRSSGQFRRLANVVMWFACGSGVVTGFAVFNQIKLGVAEITFVGLIAPIVVGGLGASAIRFFFHRSSRLIRERLELEKTARRDLELEVKKRTEHLDLEIAERKNAEASLRRSESQIRGMLEASPLGVSIIGGDGERKYVNARYAEMHGADVEDLVGKHSDTGVLDEIDGEWLRTEFAAKGSVRDWEGQLRRADGSSYWALVTILPTEFDGAEARMVWIYDITDRKKAGEALQESEQRFKTVLDNMPAAVFLRDRDGRFTVVNKGYQDIYRVDEDDLAGKRVHDILPADEADKFAAEDKSVLTTGQAMEFETTVDHDGDRRILAASKFPIHDLAGDVEAVGGVEIDITDRKLAERAIKANESILTTILENMPAAVFLKELDGRFIRINQHYQDQYGPDRHTIAGKTLYDIYPAEMADELTVLDRQVIDAGINAEQENILVGDDGREQIFRSNMFPVFDSSGDMAAIGGFAVDVTEQKEAETELRLARDAAEEATKAKASFLAQMSHEIRTPMGGVIGMIDLLQQTKLDEDQHHMTSTVRNSANALLTIINDILDFSKIEAGKLDLEEVPISLRDAVEGVGEALAVNARNKNIGLEVFVDPDIPDAVLGDQVRVRQILFNLGGNAIKFTETGKVLIRADRLADKKDGSATIHFSIIDDGIGIPKEAQANLFTAFSQVEASTTRRFGGTGLGLSICQRLTELMDGEIGVDSEPEEGSTFHTTITFPVVDDPSIKSDGLDLDGLKILLAIEDGDMRDLTPRYLEHWKAEVVAIATLEDLEETASAASADEKPFDVIGLFSGQALSEQIDLVGRLNDMSNLASKRFIVACAGRDRSERKPAENTLYIDTNPLIREKLIRTVAAAAGRISPDVTYEEEDAPLKRAKAPTVEEAKAAGQLVLFAEDNLTNQDVIGRQLNLLGYAYEVASDGKQALEMYREKSYAILLTDCHMPVMDGFDLAKNIRQSEKGGDERLPIVAITASVMKEEVDSCYAAGMDDYLPKPLEMPKLKDMLRKRMPETSASVEEPVIAEEQVQEPDKGNGPIDPSALKKVFGDDDETFKEILGDFVAPALANVDEIMAAKDDASSKGVGAAAHKLKSSSRAVGAGELADVCQALETAGHDDDWETINDLAPKLRPLYEDVKSYIDAL